MAQNTDVVLPKNTWTQLTNSNVTSITFQNRSGYHILVKGTAGATAPTDQTGSIRYNAGQGELNTPLADLFAGIGANRVYAYAPDGATVMVSHA